MKTKSNLSRYRSLLITLSSTLSILQSISGFADSSLTNAAAPQSRGPRVLTCSAESNVSFPEVKRVYPTKFEVFVYFPDSSSPEIKNAKIFQTQAALVFSYPNAPLHSIATATATIRRVEFPDFLILGEIQSITAHEGALGAQSLGRYVFAPVVDGSRIVQYTSIDNLKVVYKCQNIDSVYFR
jgi:hypothetical protein